MKQAPALIQSNRRSFLKKSALAAGTATLASGLLSRGLSTFAQTAEKNSGPLSAGDVAILRFLAAAELIESDLWNQYAELGGIGNNLPIEVNPNQT